MARLSTVLLGCSKTFGTHEFESRGIPCVCRHDYRGKLVDILTDFSFSLSLSLSLCMVQLFFTKWFKHLSTMYHFTLTLSPVELESHTMVCENCFPIHPPHLTGFKS